MEGKSISVGLRRGYQLSARGGERWLEVGGTFLPRCLLFAQEHQGKFGHLLRECSDLRLQACDLVAQIGSGRRYARLRSRSGGRLGRGRGKRGARSRVFASLRQRVRKAAAMQVGELLELGRGQAFEARIGRMRAAGEVGGFEPEP